MLDHIHQLVRAKKPIDTTEALWLWENASNEDLKNLATSVRDRFHKPGEATWLMMAIINYTNICVAGCDYCSFYRYPHQKDGYLLSKEKLDQRISEAVDLGCQMIGFNGGFHPKLHMHDYAEQFAHIHRKWPDMTFYEMTVAEFIFCCKVSKISWKEGARILKEAGTKWVTGGGAEILTEDFRKRHSPGKGSVKEYFEAQSVLLEEGLGSTATMVIGFDETLAERMDHLEKLRTFQAENKNGLPSFLCWTYKPWNNELGGEEISTEEYLRWLAICRIYLHNIPHIRTSVLTRNELALQGLLYGADDFDLPTEDEVTTKAGATITHSFKKILEACPNSIKLVKRDPWNHQQALHQDQSDCAYTQSTQDLTQPLYS